MNDKTKKYFKMSFRIISGIMSASDFDAYETDRNNKYGNRGWLLGVEISPDESKRVVYVYPVEGEYLSKVATNIKTLKIDELITRD